MDNQGYSLITLSNGESRGLLEREREHNDEHQASPESSATPMDSTTQPREQDPTIDSVGLLRVPPQSFQKHPDFSR